jgi:hypothetical protein
VTHWVDKHDCADSPLSWSAETSRTSHESKADVQADGVMVGAGMTGRHCGGSGRRKAGAGSVRERATQRRRCH